MNVEYTDDAQYMQRGNNAHGALYQICHEDCCITSHTVHMDLLLFGFCIPANELTNIILAMARRPFSCALAHIE